MWFIYFWLTSSAICLVGFLVANVTIKKNFLQRFEGTELKELFDVKSGISRYFIMCAISLVPFLNIVFLCIVIWNLNAIMDEIIKNIKDTVDVVRIIKPIYNFKASE
jgi:hypothetical protein